MLLALKARTSGLGDRWKILAILLFFGSLAFGTLVLSGGISSAKTSSEPSTEPSTIAGPGSASIGSIPTGTTLYWYQVRTQGFAAGSIPFNRTGWLVVASPTITRTGTQNGLNARDFFLITGNPAVSPQTGAIEWSTNSALHDLAHGSSQSSRAKLDTAFMGCTGTSIANLGCNINIDSRISLSDAQNNFNTSSGILGDIYRIYSGSLRLQFSNGGSRVTGFTSTIWWGRGYLYGWGRYSTTISGAYYTTTRA